MSKVITEEIQSHFSSSRAANLRIIILNFKYLRIRYSKAIVPRCYNCTRYKHVDAVVVLAASSNYCSSNDGSSFTCISSLSHAKYMYKNYCHVRKFFRNLKIPMNIHKYCSNCFAAIKETQLPHICCTCNAKLESKTSVSYFVELDIVTQLQNFFRKPGFTQLLQYRFEKAEKQSTIISDIYDGCQYKKLFPGGPLDNPNNLTFSWNNDGVPLFKSSNFGSWPFFLSINELPPGKRFLWDYQILGGLWFGPSKPFMNKFLNPLYKKISKLETEGTDIYMLMQRTDLLEHS